VTSDYGSDCGFLGSPFINNCNYSVPYNILNHIYGDIKEASSSSAKTENVNFERMFISDMIIVSPPPNYV